MPQTMKTYKQFIEDIQESSLSRIQSKSDKGGMATMSASRGDKSAKENRERAKQLIRIFVEEVYLVLQK